MEWYVPCGRTFQLNSLLTHQDFVPEKLVQRRVTALALL